MTLPKTTTRKKWYKSKTLWFNVAMGVGSAIEMSLYSVQGYFDPRVLLVITAITAGVNVVLRFISSERIGR